MIRFIRKRPVLSFGVAYVVGFALLAVAYAAGIEPCQEWWAC